MIHIWMESLFDKEANLSGLMSKAIRNQWESSKQVTVQNLSGRCVAVFWPFGPCNVLALPRDANRGPWTSLRLYNK
jgi:hypothetical protein